MKVYKKEGEGDNMLAIPWWVYLVVLGVIFSGYMAIRTANKEKEVDQIYIEREGEVYMDRIKEARASQGKETDESKIG